MMRVDGEGLLLNWGRCILIPLVISANVTAMSRVVEPTPLLQSIYSRMPRLVRLVQSHDQDMTMATFYFFRVKHTPESEKINSRMITIPLLIHVLESCTDRTAVEQRVTPRDSFYKYRPAGLT